MNVDNIMEIIIGIPIAIVVGIWVSIILAGLLFGPEATAAAIQWLLRRLP